MQVLDHKGTTCSTALHTCIQAHVIQNFVDMHMHRRTYKSRACASRAHAHTRTNAGAGTQAHRHRCARARARTSKHAHAHAHTCSTVGRWSVHRLVITKERKLLLFIAHQSNASICLDLYPLVHKESCDVTKFVAFYLHGSLCEVLCEVFDFYFTKKISNLRNA